MDTEFESIIKEQAVKLPTEVRKFFVDSDWGTTLDAIIAEFAIPEEVSEAFRNEILIILLGLMHPDALREELSKILLTRGENLTAIVTEVEEKIFAPIRPALIKFFEDERALAEKNQEVAPPAETDGEQGGWGMPLVEAHRETPVLLEQTMMPERAPDLTPLNLPMVEENPFLPKLIPKVTEPNSGPVNPFEEKMKSVFTSSPTETPALVPPPFLEMSPETAVPPQIIPPSPPQAPSSTNARHDPYREPLE